MSLFDHPVFVAQMEAARARAELEKDMPGFEIEKRGADFEVIQQSHKDENVQRAERGLPPLLAPKSELDALLQDSLQRAKEAGVGPTLEFSEIMDRIAAGREDAPLTPPGEAENTKQYLAAEALRITSGERRKAYGPPENNFARIARFWDAYFKNTGRDIDVTAADVSPLMRFIKEARLCETPDHLDSFVDLVGYTLTGSEVNGVAAPSAAVATARREGP